VVNNPAMVGPYRCGRGARLLVIAGPCVIESEELTLSIAGRLAQIAAELPIALVFKASFDKANRTSIDAFRGLGIEKGLAILERVKRTTGLPVTTDIHESHQAGAAGGAVRLNAGHENSRFGREIEIADDPPVKRNVLAGNSDVTAADAAVADEL